MAITVVKKSGVVGIAGQNQGVFGSQLINGLAG